MCIRNNASLADAATRKLEGRSDRLRRLYLHILVFMLMGREVRRVRWQCIQGFRCPCTESNTKAYSGTAAADKCSTDTFMYANAVEGVCWRWAIDLDIGLFVFGS